MDPKVRSFVDLCLSAFQGSEPAALRTDDSIVDEMA